MCMCTVGMLWVSDLLGAGAAVIRLSACTHVKCPSRTLMEPEFKAQYFSRL